MDLLHVFARPAASADKKHDPNGRLRALRRYRILDTDGEQEFQDIVVEAARECHAPIALISLIDKNRQWFKANLGIDARETDLSRSICAKAIEDTGVFVVPDTDRDPRTNTNPLVTGELHIKFYAGAPLITPDGHALGMVCVLDVKARPLGISTDESAALTRLATLVMEKLEARVAARFPGEFVEAP